MKIFAHEHLLFTPAQLRVHIERGDVNLSASDQKGFTGHPQCEFCRIRSASASNSPAPQATANAMESRFYDNESLFRHLREAHEQCFICTQNGTGRDQYFVNYKELEQHFESAHFTCSAQICRDAKFVVFETAGELQAHEIQTHGEALSHTTKRAMKEARRLQVDFSYDSQSATAAQTSASAAAGQDSRARAEESERRARAREMFAARGDTEDGSSSDRLRSVPGLPASGRAARGGRAAFSGQLSTDEASRQAQRDTEQKACVVRNSSSLVLH